MRDGARHPPECEDLPQSVLASVRYTPRHRVMPLSSAKSRSINAREHGTQLGGELIGHVQPRTFGAVLA